MFTRAVNPAKMIGGALGLAAMFRSHNSVSSPPGHRHFPSPSPEYSGVAAVRRHPGWSGLRLDE